MKRLLIITGPTASGKSEICVNLAKIIKGVILNCDSKQIYKEIPIITAQPNSFYNEISHKLYGYVSVNNHYSVGSWIQDLQNVVQKISKQENNIIVTGGSGLYISSLIDGMSIIPEIDNSIKDYAKKKLQDIGNDEFYKLLVMKDSSIKDKIHPNNVHRLLRSFEVFEQTGKPLSEWHILRNKPFNDYKIDLLVLLPSREELYHKINERCIHILDSGGIHEVEELLSRELNSCLPAMKSHGVPEILQYLQKRITFNEALTIFQQNTRNYAKRQYTWFRNKFPNALYFNNSDEIIKYVIKNYNNL